MPLRILFISRAYPPVVGGIENQNFSLGKELHSQADTTIIANRFGKKMLPLFLPYALIYTLVSIRKYDAILLGDGVLSLVGWLIKVFFPKKPVLSIVHGLDITYPFFLYQILWVQKFLPRLDRLIAVGNETIETGIRHGIPRERFKFVPNGIDPNQHFHPEYTRKDLEGVIDTSVSGKQVLLTIGRLARRKGVAWFIRNVLPSLPKTTLYVIAGDGQDRDNIRAAIEETRLFTQVKTLGYITNHARDILMNTADIFIQPNISVPNDMEGFGLTPLEAASCGTPVIVSRLEGLRDAFSEGRNGMFAEPENASDWKQKIERLISDKSVRNALRESARQYIIQNFSWNTISAQYMDCIEETIARVTGEHDLKKAGRNATMKSDIRNKNS